MIAPSIFNYIKEEENRFQTQQIQIGDNWNWNFRDHVQLIFHLKNGIFYTGENDWLRAFKNTMEPILNLSYWTEDIEVKDVVFYVENDNNRVLSFLLKKYHDEVYVREHNLDTFFDEITESDIDYGGVLVKKGKMPEVVALNSVAFCDQTDLMEGPVFFKTHFSPDGLKKMVKKGWGKESNGATISLEELAVLASPTKEFDKGLENQVPSKVVEVYIGYGDFPEHYLYDNNDMENYCKQVHVVAFYTDEKSNKQGVTLYRKKDYEDNLMFFTSKKVYGRALGRGVGESLLHPQIWTNFLTIHKMKLLESASKIPLFTDDPSYSTANKIQDMDNLEITVIKEGRKIGQVPTAAPANIQLLQGAVNDWFEFSQFSGAAFDPILGKGAVSGTTFRGQERTVAQGRGLHDKRRGQRAKFIEEIYRAVIIPQMIIEIRKGQKFLATLTTEEMHWVAEKLATKQAKKSIDNMVLNRMKPTEEQQQMIIDTLKKDFFKNGNKRMIEVLKDEFEDAEIKMGINVAGKQKDLAVLSDKILAIFQYIFQNPAGFQQAMQIPALAKSFENILEFSNIPLTDFASLMEAPTLSPMQPQKELAPTEPIEQ